MEAQRAKAAAPPPASPAAPAAHPPARESDADGSDEDGGGDTADGKDEGKDPKQDSAPLAAEAEQEADPNRLAAEALRAKLMGDTARHDRLMAQVARLKAGGGAAKPRPAAGKKESEEEVVVISELDAEGRPRVQKHERVLPGNERGHDRGPDTRAHSDACVLLRHFQPDTVARPR